MKFTDLKLTTQVALAGSLTSLKVELPRANFGHPFITSHGNKKDEKDKPLNKSAQLLKDAGIDINADELPDAYWVAISKDDPNEPNTNVPRPAIFNHHTSGNILRFNNSGTGVELRIDVQLSPDSTEHVVFDRFGLLGNVRIKGDLKESLVRVITVLKTLSESLTQSEEIVNLLQVLHEGVIAAESLPEEIIAAAANSRTTKAVFGKIVSTVNYSDFDYDEDTGNRINLPPIICEQNGFNTIVTYYTYMYNSANQSRLLVEYADDIILVSMNLNGSNKLEIGSVPVDIELGESEFIEFLINAVDNIITNSEHNTILVNQKEHFITTVKNAKPFILDSLNK